MKEAKFKILIIFLMILTFDNLFEVGDERPIILERSLPPKRKLNYWSSCLKDGTQVIKKKRSKLMIRLCYLYYFLEMSFLSKLSDQKQFLFCFITNRSFRNLKDSLFNYPYLIIVAIFYFYYQWTFIYNNKIVFCMNPQLHYLTHMQNSSYSKQSHSFSRAARFQSLASLQTDFKYHPKLQTKSRSCTFGFGNRSSLSRKGGIPPPNSFNLSRFPINKRSATLGFSREYVKFGTLKFEIDKKAKIPPPGAYEIPNMLRSTPFTLKPRLPDDITIQLQKNTPGPGKYEAISISANGKYPASKFRNTRTILVDMEKNGPRRQEHPGLGPGSYDLFNSESKYSPEKVDAMRRTKTKIFGTAKRAGPEQKHRIFVPGPGEYSSFSEFDCDYVNQFKRSKTEY